MPKNTLKHVSTMRCAVNWHINTAIKPAVAIYALKMTKNVVVHNDCTTIKQVILKLAPSKCWQSAQ